MSAVPLPGEKFSELEVPTTQGSLNLPRAMVGECFVLFGHPEA